MKCYRFVGLGVMACATTLLLVFASTLRADTLPPAIAAKPDFRQVIAQAKEKVFPAVVYIRVISENMEGGVRTSRSSSGSGVIISAEGEVLTNWHVVDRATEVRCLLADGRAFKSSVVGSDKDSDIALVKLETDEVSGAKPRDLPYAMLGDSDHLAEGDFVMAMGAPWGMSRSVSIGIISCVNRYLDEASEYSLWLQTDASISPGNSGGPLVNTDGEVIGLDARGSMQGGDLGFAIPSSTLRRVVPELRKNGHVPWVYTGIQLQPLHDFNRDVFFEGETGVIVADVEPDSPAFAAGLQPRDHILSIDGKSFTALSDEGLPAIRTALALRPVETPIVLSVQRGTQTLEIKVQGRMKGATQGDQLDCPRWDFTVRTINQFDNADLYFHRKKGVYIQGVKSPGNASAAGLQEKDIILSIGGKDVTSLDEVKAIHDESIANVDKEHRALIVVLRNGLMRQIVLDFSVDHSKN